MSLSYLGPHRMPTLASVHSSQGTISLEMRPLQQGTVQGMSTDRQSPNDLLLDQSRLHLLLCPWEKPLHQVLQALAGSKQASKAVGKRCTPLLQQTAATTCVMQQVRNMPPKCTRSDCCPMSSAELITPSIPPPANSVCCS